MKKISLFAFLWLTTSVLFGQKMPNPLSGIDQQIDTLRRAYQAVGLAVAVVKNGQPVYTKGFGYRDLAHKLPATDSTIFPIGSATKAFTASLLGILEAQQQVSLHEKPSLYIPRLRFYTQQMDNLITIEDLLCHKSGLGSLDGSFVLFPDPDRLKLMERLRYLKPNGAIKDSWLYSNMGYYIAGTVVEQVTHQSWDKNVEERLFIPLQMRRSSTQLVDMKQTNDFSYGYGLLKGKTQTVLYEAYKPSSPAGSINSTANDMAKWMQMWLAKGQFKGQQVLPEEYVYQATTIHNIRPQDGADADVYLFGDGYGWRVESYKGHYKAHHGGNVSGFSSQVVLYPNDKLGIVVLTNQNNSLLPYIITNLISNRLLALPTTALDKYPIVVHDIHPVEPQGKGLNLDKKPTHSLDEFCGSYLHKGYGTLKIVQESSSLYVLFGAYKFKLEHLHYDVFVARAVADIPQVMDPGFILSFSLNNAGEVSSVGIDLQSEPVKFLKQPAK